MNDLSCVEWVLIYSKNGNEVIIKDEIKTNLIKYVIKYNIATYKIMGVYKML
jgi:hypothetical protein